MAKKKKDTVEFRYYEIPQGDAALVLCGESWIRVYGHEEFHLHFHNLMEIGICRYGAGDLYLDPKSVVDKLFPDNPIYQKEIIDTLNRAPMITERGKICYQHLILIL